MRYAGIIKNDTAAAPGLCYSFYTQGCNKHCPGCHNPETWSFDGGKELPHDFFDTFISDIHANGIDRSFAILGGEPLNNENIFLTTLLVKEVSEKSPKTLIYIWSGYTYEELQQRSLIVPNLKYILNRIDVLVAGPYIQEKRDISAYLTGSSNQEIIYMKREKRDEET